MRGPANHVGMLLVKVFLKLWQLVQVPLLLSEAITGIAELSSATAASATVTTEARRAAAIAGIRSNSWVIDH